MKDPVTIEPYRPHPPGLKGHADDAELAARARSGDRLALAEIYRRHRAAVGRHVLMHARDPAAVDDLVQDTFVTAFDQLERYTGRCRLSTWLHGIAINVARNHRRKQRRRRGLLQRVFAPRESSPASAEEHTRERRAMDALYVALDALPSDQRDAFVVRVLEQVPLAEAAEVLGAPIATISYRARQAEQKVRTRLSQGGIE